MCLVNDYDVVGDTSNRLIWSSDIADQPKPREYFATLNGPAVPKNVACDPNPKHSLQALGVGLPSG